MNKTRTFISIEPPPNIIQEIKKIQSHISTQKFTGKLTEENNLHLTLKFLGEINQLTLNKVKHLLSKINFPTFEAALSNIGLFSHHKKPRIVWLKISGPLTKLQKEIDESLSPIFPKENRFMSHLTIARIKIVKTPDLFQNHIKQIPINNLPFPITEFKLKSSTLEPQGPIYKTLKSFKLTSTTP